MSRFRHYIIALSALVTISACAATTDITPPDARSTYADSPQALVLAPMPTTHRLLFDLASRGLLYTSESDYPFKYFRHAGTGGPTNAALSVAEFRSLLGIDAGTPIEVISLDSFFARHIERVDPFDDVGQALIPRYVRLRETLRASLLQLFVYRVGQIAIDCYVVGFNANGDLEGLTTISIET